MTICSKCGKETNVICICGFCPKCNGTSKMMNVELKRLIDKHQLNKQLKHREQSANGR